MNIGLFVQKAKVMLKCFSIFLAFVFCEKSIFLSDRLYCTLSSIAVALHCMYVHFSKLLEDWIEFKTMTDSAKKTESETSNQIYFVQSGSWDLVPSSYFFQDQGQPLRRTTNWPDGGIMF